MLLSVVWCRMMTSPVQFACGAGFCGVCLFGRPALGFGITLHTKCNVVNPMENIILKMMKLIDVDWTVWERDNLINMFFFFVKN